MILLEGFKPFFNWVFGALAMVAVAFFAMGVIVGLSRCDNQELERESHTKILPKYTITTSEKDGVIESDTLYVYEFDYYEKRD